MVGKNRVGLPPKPVEQDRAGHPNWFTPDRAKIILEALLSGAHRSTSARLAGVSNRSMTNWMRDNPDFAEQVEAAEARCEHGLLLDLYRLARGVPPPEGRERPDLKAITFILERRFHARWKERTETTFRIEENDPLEELEHSFAQELARIVEAEGAGALPGDAPAGHGGTAGAPGARLALGGAPEPGAP